MQEVPAHLLNPRPGLLFVLFTGYRHADVTDAELQATFQPYGLIRQINVFRGRPAAEVDFEKREDAEKALDEVDGRELEDGVNVCVGWTKKSYCSDDVRVCRVPAHVTRQQLWEAFNRYDDVRCAGFQYKPWNAERTGYAYVTFITRERALKAKQRFRARIDKDGTPLISWESSIVYRMPGNAPTVTIAFIPRDTTEEAVRSRFEAFGEILTVELKDQQKTGAYVAEIRFTEAQHAKQAIDTMDGAHFRDAVIRVSWSPKSRPQGLGHLSVDLLPEDADRKTLIQRLESYGDIRRAEVRYNWHNGESMCSGDVTFATREQASAAAKTFSGRRWQGAAHNGKWTVDWCDGNVLVAFDLPSDVTDGQMWKIFGDFGQVSNIHLVFDQVGAFKGHAFVIYGSRDDAERAIDAMDGAQLDGKGPIRVIWKDTSRPEGNCLALVGLASACAFAFCADAQVDVIVVSFTLPLLQSEANSIEAGQFGRGNLVHFGFRYFGSGLWMVADSYFRKFKLQMTGIFCQMHRRSLLDPEVGPYSRRQNVSTALFTAFRWDMQVKNLPPTMDGRALKGLFSEFDGILRTEVLYDWTTGKSLGAGFVRFATQQQAFAALEASGGFVDEHGTKTVVLSASDELGSEDDSKPVTLTFKSTVGIDHSDDEDVLINH